MQLPNLNDTVFVVVSPFQRFSLLTDSQMSSASTWPTSRRSRTRFPRSRSAPTTTSRASTPTSSTNPRPHRPERVPQSRRRLWSRPLVPRHQIVPLHWCPCSTSRAPLATSSTSSAAGRSAWRTPTWPTGMQFKRHLGFRARFRNNFQDNFSTEALQI